MLNNSNTWGRANTRFLGGLKRTDSSWITPGYSASLFQWLLMHSNRLSWGKMGTDGIATVPVSRWGSILVLQHYHVRCHSSFLVGLLLFFFPVQREGMGELQATGSCQLLSATTKVALLKADKKKPLNHATKVNPRSWKNPSFVHSETLLWPSWCLDREAFLQHFGSNWDMLSPWALKTGSQEPSSVLSINILTLAG